MKNKYEHLFDEFLDVTEFRLVKNEDKKWSLIDLQGANLGNIESERFESADDIFDRMENYIADYFLHDIDELLQEKGVEVTWDENYEEYIENGKPLLPEHGFDFDILDMICYHAEEIDLSNCFYIED